MVEILICLVAVDIVLTLCCLVLLAGTALPPPGVRTETRPDQPLRGHNTRTPMRYWPAVRENILERAVEDEIRRRRERGQV